MIDVTVGINQFSKVEVELSKYRQLCLCIFDNRNQTIPGAYIVIGKEAINKILLPSLLLCLSQLPEIFSNEELREIEFQSGCILEDRMREKEKREKEKVECLK